MREALTSAHSVMHAWQTRCPHGASCTSAACSVRQIGHPSRAPGGTLTSAAAFFASFSERPTGMPRLRPPPAAAPSGPLAQAETLAPVGKRQNAVVSTCTQGDAR